MLINAVCGVGSTGRIVSDMWALLKTYGHEVKVVYGVGEARNVDEDDLIRCNDMRGYYIHNALARVTDRAGFYSFFQTKRLIKQMKQFSPELIHLHNLHGFYINIKLLFEYLAEANIPVVWTLHDCWAFTGHCTYFTYIGCDKWKTGCSLCPQKKNYPISLVMDQSKRNYQDKKRLFTSVANLTLVTPSQWLADLVKQSYLGKFPVYAMPNGIDLDVFKPTVSQFRQQYHIGDRKMILAVANVWSERKGFYDLCKLADMLDKEQYVLVVVGVTGDQISQLPKDVIAIKRTQNVQELVQIYSTADVFVNMSYEETMGLVTAEALACGTPAIVYDATAVPEVVDSGSGVVIKAGDVHGICKTIQKVTKKAYPNTRKRAYVFERDKQYREYLNIYQESVGK